MAENIPVEFENIGEYNQAVLQQLINNNALLHVLLDIEVNKLAQDMVRDEMVSEDYDLALKEKRNELKMQINEKIREYKLHALADINLKK
ncbi:hypothetical protein BMS3Abin04_00918 [bacterium BMS3Abin04]|nr:hypothetical protein BMS3Abin04_00918 [bacterium BMS3Abin04]